MFKSNIFKIFKYSITYGILKSFTFKTAIDCAIQNKHQEIIELLSNTCIQSGSTWTKSIIINENWCLNISVSTYNYMVL